jgi:hypothetical protein
MSTMNLELVSDKLVNNVLKIAPIRAIGWLVGMTLATVSTTPMKTIIATAI